MCSVLLLFGLVPFLLNGQELVRNGGFEEHGPCPVRFDKKPAKGVVGVKTIGGMPGYFHACSEGMGTPGNWAGVQAPFEGDAYMGLVLTAHGGNECAVREFVQLELERPLVNGGKYLLSFRVSLADRSGYMTDRIGACFSKEDRSGKKGVASSIGRPDVDNKLDSFLTDTAGWMLVEGIYNARGGERFVQVGNFQLCDRTSRKALVTNKGDGVMSNLKKRGALDLDPDEKRKLRRKMLASQSYVYVDGVSLVPMREDVVEAKEEPVGCPADPGPPVAEQELVPDPHFDLNQPTHRAQWKNASGGTPDLVEGEVGIYLHSAVNKDHREYIHTRLKEPLDPCGTYGFRMRVRRNPAYDHAVDRIGVVLVDTFHNDRRRGILPYATSWSSMQGALLDNTAEWTTLCGEFQAPGCSRTLIIGNFYDDDSTTIAYRPGDGGPFAYYFVDDVSLWRTGEVEGCALECPSLIAEAPPPDSTGTNEVLPLWPRYLRFDVADHIPSSDLLHVAEEMLAALAEDPARRFTVTGHTDDSGTAAANALLAERRAKSVRDTLVQLGVPFRSMNVEGLGSTQPMAPNDTAEGRALNRRVAIAPVVHTH